MGPEEATARRLELVPRQRRGRDVANAALGLAKRTSEAVQFEIFRCGVRPTRDDPEARLGLARVFAPFPERAHHHMRAVGVAPGQRSFKGREEADLHL